MNYQEAAEIAAAHGRKTGLAEFSIDVVARRTTNEGVEWVVSLRFEHSVLTDCDHAIVIVDDQSGLPRLIQSL